MCIEWKFFEFLAAKNLIILLFQALIMILFADMLQPKTRLLLPHLQKLLNKVSLLLLVEERQQKINLKHIGLLILIRAMVTYLITAL